MPLARIAIVLVLGCAAGGAAFACENAGTWAERTICQYDELMRQSREVETGLARLAKHVIAVDRERLRAEQRSWLAARDGCRSAPAPVKCLAESHRARIEALAARLARANAPRRVPQQGNAEPFLRQARALQRQLPVLRQRIVDAAGGAVVLWTDAGLPAVLFEPAAQAGARAGQWTRYYFRDGALFMVERPGDRAGFENGEMVFWSDRTGARPSEAEAGWEARQQGVLARAAQLLALFDAS
jgi:uncharacterized protein YecT (DUF1311 family)